MEILEIIKNNNQDNDYHPISVDFAGDDVTIDLAHNQLFHQETLNSLIQLLTYLRDAGYRVRIVNPPPDFLSNFIPLEELSNMLVDE